MLDFGVWQEILSTMRKNKMRTILTGISVLWGIFMLIILLGSGSGLENAAKNSFSRGAVNSVWIHPGTTSMSFQGMKPGRAITFHNNDYTQTKQNYEIVDITSRFNIRFNTVLSYKNKTAEYEISSAQDADMFIEQMDILSGRFINKMDMKKSRKVAVISPIVKDYFFGKNNPLGKYIIANGVAFKVVGVFKDASERNHYRIYIPTSTAQTLYNGQNTISYLGLTVNKNLGKKEAEKFEGKLRNQFAKRHKFSTDDKRALHINNNWEHFNQMLNVFLGIKLFIWFIGIMSIIAAIVSVANIMLITVKERTVEIGIRKALGATPGSIIKIVLFESILITSFFGYLGLFFGTAIIEFIATKLPPNDMFSHPEVDLNTAIGATILLIIAGTLAGYVPARKAANVKPIVALRDE